MMLSILVIAFLLAMIWMWAQQGLFSAFIHLILTIIAGCVAFAFWEPFVYGFLINRMPEQAWGLGLLIPFAVAIIALRTVFDTFVPGNLNFHNLVDNAGGAICGYCSGLLTAGLLLIGLQMVGMPSVAGYQGWKFDNSGELVRGESLLIPADKIAGDFFTYLSGGALSPVIGNSSLAIYHPNPAKEASLFHQSPFWDQGFNSTRRALSPSNIQLVENGYLTPAAGEVPRALKSQITARPGERLVVVGTEILNKAENGAVASDPGGLFRIARGQIALVAEDSQGGPEYYYPIGYIQEGEYESLLGSADFARSGAASSTAFHWVFVVPEAARPLFLNLKQTRVPLTAQQPVTELAALDRLISGVAGGGILDATRPPPPTEPGAEQPDTGQFAVVSPSLMVRMNKNKLTDFSLNYDEKTGALISGQDRYVPNQEDRFVADKMTVSHIYHDTGTRVVRVNLGRKGDARSWLGRSKQFAAQVAPPELVSAEGKRYQAIGYVRREGAATYFRIDPNNKITSFAQLGIGAFSEGSDVYLFFHVDVGQTIVSFEIGNTAVTRERIDPPLVVQ